MTISEGDYITRTLRVPSPIQRSNVAKKVHERFTQNNAEKAFLKIVRELRVFGILKAVAIRK